MQAYAPELQADAKADERRPRVSPEQIAAIVDGGSEDQLDFDLASDLQDALARIAELKARR